MDDKGIAARMRDAADKVIQKCIAILVINSDAGFDRNGYGTAHLGQRLTNSAHTGGHQVGLGHQARPELAGGYPVAGAADVQVNLVEPGLGPHHSSFSHEHWIRATQLQSHRMFIGVVG